MEISLIILTLKVAAVATVINLPLALIVGWILVKTNTRYRFFLDVLISFPLALPPVTVGFLLLLVLGRTGPVGFLLYKFLSVDIVFTWFAAALASAVVSFPLISRAIVVAMGEVDERVEKTARSLGAGPWRVIFTITIPLAYKGILAGTLLGFVRSISEFGATIAVAGNIPGKTQTLSLAIYSNLQTGNEQIALYLAGISVVLAVSTLVIHNWLVGTAGRRIIGG
tara:strand:- start:3210 stop:3884 length:675 start_codon:yes stop_codon:yes gene_type:complete